MYYSAFQKTNIMFEKRNSALIFEEFQGRKNNIKDLIKVPISDPLYLKFSSEYEGLEITPDIDDILRNRA